MRFDCQVKNSDGSSIWDLPFESFTINEELNKGQTLEISFERTYIQKIADTYGVTPEFIFSGSYREIEIYDENANKIFAGYIAEIQFNKGNVDFGSISVSAKGFFSLLEKRYTNTSLSYTNTDSSDIAWGLINYTQGLSYGNLGITRGADPTTKNRDRTDLRYKNIAEVIRKMSADEVKDGYDFEVDKNKVFNVYYPKGTQRDEIYLESDFNINTYQISKTFIDGMINQAIVVGSGNDTFNQLVEIRNSANTYKSAFFLLQEVLNESDVSVATTLQDKGDKLLEIYQAPRYTISLTCRYDNPNWVNFEVGDSLKVVIGEYQINDFYRVRKRSVNSKGDVSISFKEY